MQTQEAFDASPELAPDGFWLDLLPLGVCENIAHFAAKLESRTTALHLAESSPKQRSAVVGGLEFSYVWVRSGKGLWDTKRWADVFLSSARVVETRDYMPDKIFTPLLQSSTLRRAAVDEKPDFLNALCSASSLRELVVFVRDCPHDAFLDTLTKLSIKKLSLDFHHENAPDITFPEMCAAVGNDFISSRCPQLECLEIHCKRCDSETLIKVIEGFSELRELSIDSRIMHASAPGLVDALRRVDSVKLEMEEGLDVALAIGAPVVMLGTDELANVEDLLQFPRLEKLCIGLGTVLDEDRYEELSKAFAQLQNLRALSIQYDYPELDPVQSRTAAGEATNNLLKIIEGLPNLTDLELGQNVYGKVSENELISVLVTLGPRLKRFKTLFWQDRFDYGMPYERLLRLLITMAGHNRGLEYVKLSSMIDSSSFTPEALEQLEVEQERRSRLKCAQELINRHVPGLFGDFVDRTADVACRRGL